LKKSTQQLIDIIIYGLVELSVHVTYD